MPGARKFTSYDDDDYFDDYDDSSEYTESDDLVAEQKPQQQRPPIRPIKAKTQPKKASPAPKLTTTKTPASSKLQGVLPLDTTLTEAIISEDGREALRLVISGHVDTGKSTLLGHLLVQLGYITEKTLKFCIEEAKRLGKSTFHFAWLLDQSEEERRRGITVEAGVFHFETLHRRISVLDAPGHADYFENMASSALLADVSVLVVSALEREFEAGRQNMTTQHAGALSTLGIKQIIVAVNKMDLVNFSQEQYNRVVNAVTELFSANIANTTHSPPSIRFVPLAAFTGVNLAYRGDGKHTESLFSWYDGPSLLELLDETPSSAAMLNYPTRLLVHDFFGSTVHGYLLTGSLRPGDKLTFEPTSQQGIVKALSYGSSLSNTSSSDSIQSRNNHSQELKSCYAGDTIEVILKVPKTFSVLPGHVGGVLHPHRHPLPMHITSALALLTMEPTFNSVVLPGSMFRGLLHCTFDLSVTVEQLFKGAIDPQALVETEAPKQRLKFLGPGGVDAAVIRFSEKVVVAPSRESRVLGRLLLLSEGVLVGRADIVTPK